MNQRELRALYEVREETDARTGKLVRKAYYIGKYFSVDEARLRRARPVLWGAWLLALAAFVTGGCTMNAGSRCPWVMPGYVCCMLPLFYMAMALWKISRMGARIDQVQKTEGIDSARHSGMGLALLGAWWTLGDAVFLFTGTYASLGMELLFLLCGLITAASGAVMTIVTRRMRTTETNG